MSTSSSTKAPSVVALSSRRRRPTPAMTVHRWEVDVLPTVPEAPLTLWRDGEYVAHLDRSSAEALAGLLLRRAAEVGR